MSAQKRTDEMLISILNELAVKPDVRACAKKHGISRIVVYQWAADQTIEVEWLGVKAPFGVQLRRARAVSVAVVDETARHMAIHGHTAPKFSQGGHPIWKICPIKASFASQYEGQTLRDMQELQDGHPDIFLHDPQTGGLIQEVERTPPNPTLVNKLLVALHPDYRERIEHSHTVGGVLRLSAAPSAQMKIADADFDVLAENPEAVALPTNVLAVAAPCESVEEYEEVFGGRRLVEGTLCFGEDGKLLPPRSEIIIVEGSSLDREYAAAGIAHSVTTPESLIAQGYVNPFLLKLAEPAVESAGARDACRARMDRR
jgi:hypothetical protein